MHARARGVEISTYAWLDKPNQNRGQIKHYETEQIQMVIFDALLKLQKPLEKITQPSSDLYTTRARMHIASP